jgi:hypothetical protein
VTRAVAVEVPIDSRCAPAQFLGGLLVRNAPIIEDIGVKLLQILDNHRVPNRLSLTVQPLLPAEKHA